MPPNSEPTPQDIASVAESLGAQPVQQMQPEQPTPQPAPTQTPQEPVQQPAPQPAQPAEQTDPFASLFASQPQEPVQEQQPAQQPTTQPLEPTAPQQPAEQPQQSQQPQQPQGQSDDYQSYEDYMNSVMANVPQAPETPDPESIDPNDPAAIKNFFDELMNTAVARANAEQAQRTALQTSEKKLWDDAMDKYGTLRSNKEMRDMVHNIRIANFQRGVAMTPTQAAEKLLTALQTQYRQGVADNQVVTTIESVQPQGGQSGQPVSTSLDTENTLTAVQTGGEIALADILDQEIKAGRL